MAIPALPGIKPGGDIVEAMNELSKLRLNQASARYAPLTKQAEAASKLTYANLMGPQFMAKLFGNEHVIPQLSETQRKEGLGKIYGAANGQGTGANLFGNMQQGGSQFGLVGNLINSLWNHHKNSQDQGNQENTMNAQAPILQQQGNNQQDNGMMPPPSQVQGSGAVMPNTPKPGFEALPPLDHDNGAADWIDKEEKYQGRLSEGKQSGKIRSDDIKELNDTAFNSNTMQGTLDQLSDIVNSPEFNEIRQIPIAGQHEIGWYSKFGTPAQKRMIGNFLSEQGQVVVNAAGQFKGAFRAGEQGLINTMKVNPSDMPEVASGKIQGMSLMNQMLSQRSAITARLMEDKHMSKGKAMELADKQVNGKAIRNKIDNSIKVNVKNKKTGEIKSISLSEARKLGVPNV